MRAFFVGLLFLVAVVVLAGLGVLLFPLLFVLGILLRIILSFLFVILAIWLLGKFILFVWGKIKK